MKPVEIKKDIYWVGVVDWDLRYFHGPSYTTHRGTTYNSYLILDDQVTLVDTVYAPFAGELLERIKKVVDPARIENIVVNHIETDHSGALPEVMKAAPGARIYCTAKAREGLIKHYGGAEWDYRVVKTGQELSTGRRTLSFIEAPMLHWPDSMFTYIREEALLLPNDAFGQHLATSGRFDDQVDNFILMEEAAKYYANILYPLSGLVAKKLKEVEGLNIPIEMIAPSHGVIWRTDPGQIIEAYRRWSGGEWKEKALVVYDTMWGSTETMARYITEGLAAGGVETRLYKLSASDHSDIYKELLETRLLVVGSSTIHRQFISTLSPFLDGLIGLKPLNRLGAAFGAYGWSRGAVKGIEERLAAAGIQLAQESLEILWVPDGKERERCFQWGLALAGLVKEAKA
ncbi:MAG TPA: flavodoxin domain-containing protein [Bacillota bacterium]|nr:flavodoxin domain-containing protein [Bacillota bacterium]